MNAFSGRCNGHKEPNNKAAKPWDRAACKKIKFTICAKKCP